MINLFHIPDHIIDTSKFEHKLHGRIVTEFEENFAEYVGAKYAVSFSSATNAIFLVFHSEPEEVAIPSILPSVVLDAIITGSKDETDIIFEDNVDWVGSDYVLLPYDNGRLIDSAHRVDRNQFANREGAMDNDTMVFSFFPTKPVSGCDGGMLVSNNKEVIDNLRILANNGMSEGKSSWERKKLSAGYKMYMNSIQAYIANENLKNLDFKKLELSIIRKWYNKAFGLDNTSDHLYRIAVKDNREFIAKAKAAGIECGIHYPALHEDPLFEYQGPELPKSSLAARTMVSIPFHEKLTYTETQTVIQFVHEHQ